MNASKKSYGFISQIFKYVPKRDLDLILTKSLFTSDALEYLYDIKLSGETYNKYFGHINYI
jgi:hypothetical protein